MHHMFSPQGICFIYISLRESEFFLQTTNLLFLFKNINLTFYSFFVDASSNIGEKFHSSTYIGVCVLEHKFEISIYSSEGFIMVHLSAIFEYFWFKLNFNRNLSPIYKYTYIYKYLLKKEDTFTA